MHIDRSRFLLLSASIAACTQTQPTSADGVEVATPIDVQPTGDDPSVEPREVQPAHAAPTSDEDLLSLCRGLQPPPGPYCESFSDTKSQCENFVRSMEPDSAEKAVQCLDARSKTEGICRYDALEECFMVGASAALEEPRLQGQCSSIVGTCSQYQWARGDLTNSTCGKLLASVKDHLEGELITCMSEGCSAASCVWSLR